MRQILGEKPHQALLTNHRSRPDLLQLQQVLGQLLVHGVDVQLDHLYAGRELSRFPLNELAEHLGPAKHSASTWLVNSVRARPYQGPEPPVFGRPLESHDTPPPATPKGPVQGGEPRRKAARAAASSGASRNRDGHPSRAAPERAASTKSTIQQQHDPTQATPVKPPQLPADAAEAARVVLGFQDLMSTFLETQRAVMTSYLGGAPDPETPVPGAPAPGREAAADLHAPFTPDEASQTAQGRAVSPEPTPPAASGAPAESEGNERQRGASAPGGGAEPAAADDRVSAAAAFTRESLTAQLVEAVSKRTGYPREMLDLNLDLEADLGVDSIKRVEILSGLIGKAQIR